MSSIQQIKQRINSVQTNRKITNVMKLVSSSKLVRLTNEMEVAKEYSSQVATVYQDIMHLINPKINDNGKTTDNAKTLYIFINSSLGLCGSYNNNIFKIANEILKDVDDCILIGSKGYQNLKDKSLINYYPNPALITMKEINEITATIINNNYQKVKLVYNHLINSLTIKAQVVTILPVQNNKQDNKIKEIIFETSPEVIINEMLPIYISSQLYGYFSEAQVAEFSTRRNSMDEATDNADKLITTLETEYHQKRQTAITQQINEIVAGAEL